MSLHGQLFVILYNRISINAIEIFVLFQKNKKGVVMSDKLTMYVLTDTHYLSPAMWVEGESINNREMGDQIAIKCTPEILRTFFRKIIEDKDSEYVLITGDLINNGDRQSHIDFQKELQVLTDAGKKVLVTCGTHDYAGLGDDENIFHPVYYTENGCEPAERVYKTELTELYYEYGHKYAHSCDSESGSYSVKLSGNVRLIAIYDNGNGRSHCGLFDEGFRWLENEIIQAGEEGETVILAVHHPVIPPWDIYKDIAEFEMFGGYRRLRELMCKHGVKLVLTGHTHVHGIKKYTDDEGRYFYDVTTSALPSAKGRMRKLVFDPATGICEIDSIGIDSIDNFDTKGKSAEEYISSLNFVGLVKKRLPTVSSDWNGFVDDVSHVVNIEKLRAHPFISKLIINKVSGMKMSFFGRFGAKAGGLTKDEIRYLKNILLVDTVFDVAGNVFAGNGPYPPYTPEYKTMEGCLIKLEKLLSFFRVDINSLLPGEDSLLETAKSFMYNTRTGDDDKITIKMEK